MSPFELRKSYLDFFASKGHAIISAASLIPENDPSLLFVNSGMFPLVPYLLGEKHPAGKRLCNSQPSFRTKDIEEVGDHRHNTLFEMLGNWSLGDYFKKEQLSWWYEFLVEVLKLDSGRLYQTVYGGSKDAPKDTQAIEILKEVFQKYGIKAEEGPQTSGKGEDGPGVEIHFGGNQRIFAYVDKNWWQRGDAVGEPGGPDSETFYDTGKEHDAKYGKYCHVNCDCGRFIEIGNSVFMQYKKSENGWEELQNKNIDFGGGFERLTMAHEGKDNVFTTELFMPIMRRISELSGKSYENEYRAFEIIADHIKAAVFILADGAVPSNMAQGYFTRRLIRRAIRFGDHIGMKEDFLADIAHTIIGLFSNHYAHLEPRKAFIVDEMKREERKFRETLDTGLKMFEKSAQSGSLSGREAFVLFSTYGFPYEMSEELAKENGVSIDRAAFEEEMKKHRELSRTASAGMFKGGLADASDETTKLHTATHLLHRALKQVLGNHVNQKGSNITKDRLRFDFNFERKMTDAEIRAVEKIVDEQIAKDMSVTYEEMTVKEAKERGAIGLFEGKYGEKVKVYTVGDFSVEICGGPHVNRTGELKGFRITKEESCGSGIRRIKAIVNAK